MSWDVLIQDLPRDVASLVDIPEDFRPRPLGERQQLIAKITEAVPSWDVMDTGCLRDRPP